MTRNLKHLELQTSIAVSKNELVMDTFNKDMTTQEIIEYYLDKAKKPIVSTNFGPGEAVILHMITKVKSDIDVVWIDSGYCTAPTYRFAANLINRLNLNMKVFHPDFGKSFRDATGFEIPPLGSEDHKKFTNDVKLEPFQRALNQLKPDYWFTAIRSEQTEYRKSLDIISTVNNGIFRIAPLLNWSSDDIETYLNLNNLPNETDYFDPTKVIDDRECGLHCKI